MTQRTIDIAEAIDRLYKQFGAPKVKLKAVSSIHCTVAMANFATFVVCYDGLVNEVDEQTGASVGITNRSTWLTHVIHGDSRRDDGTFDEPS